KDPKNPYTTKMDLTAVRLVLEHHQTHCPLTSSGIDFLRHDDILSTKKNAASNLRRFTQGSATFLCPREPRQILPRLTAGVCLIHLIRGTFRYASKKYWPDLGHISWSCGCSGH